MVLTIMCLSYHVGSVLAPEIPMLTDCQFFAPRPIVF